MANGWRPYSEKSKNPLKSISEAFKSKKKNESNKVFSYDITPKACVLVNDVEITRFMLQEMDEEMGELFGDSLRASFGILKNYGKKMMNVLWFKINSKVEPTLKKLCQSNLIQQGKLESFDLIINYLDDQIAICADHLLQSSFTRFLKGLWDILMMDLIAIVLESNSSDQKCLEKNVKLIYIKILEPLRVLFHANGAGVSATYLSGGSCNFLGGILGLYGVTKEALLELWNILEKFKTDNEPGGLREQVIHVLASKKGISFEKMALSKKS
eukprot:TRINITY_DN4964_c0_g1_i1.p1 TRINITY_DN4964_c0_g1~~TRINITY_DN4964_c0_g1_i1.p1  ORF type:complete len:270 (+),score=72.32 TRINITY_DN4964_c0_g1_i1:42-851(+)